MLLNANCTYTRMKFGRKPWVVFLEAVFELLSKHEDQASWYTWMGGH